jgi:hypothetical protein
VVAHTQFKEKIGYRLREGDFIKFGKVVFKIKEMKADTFLKNKNNKQLLNVNTKKEKTIFDPNQSINNSHHHSQNEEEEENNNNNNYNKKEVYNKEFNYETNNKKKYLPKCRICLMEDNEIDNPLISLPCACRGSLRFLHIQCLQRWFKSKLNTKTFNFMIVHSFKSLECDICKQDIPGIYNNYILFNLIYLF